MSRGKGAGVMEKTRTVFVLKVGLSYVSRSRPYDLILAIFVVGERRFNVPTDNT